MWFPLEKDLQMVARTAVPPCPTWGAGAGPRDKDSQNGGTPEWVLDDLIQDDKTHFNTKTISFRMIWRTPPISSHILMSTV